MRPSTIGARRLVLYGALALAAFDVAAQSPRVDLPPVEDFFRRARYDAVTLSPDFKLLAAVVSLNDRRNRAMIDIDNGTETSVTALRDYDLASYGWVPDRVIQIRTANLADAGGLVELKQNVLLDTSGRVLRDRSSTSQRGDAEIVASIGRDGETVLIQTRDRNQHSLDAYRYTVQTGQKQLLTFRSPGDVRSFVTDRAGRVRIAISVASGGTRRIVSYRKTDDDA